MAMGGGKYEAVVEHAIKMLDAEAAVFMVLGRKSIAGFSLATKSIAGAREIQYQLREIANQLEADIVELENKENKNDAPK